MEILGQIWSLQRKVCIKVGSGFWALFCKAKFQSQLQARINHTYTQLLVYYHWKLSEEPELQDSPKTWGRKVTLEYVKWSGLIQSPDLASIGSLDSVTG